MKKLLLIFLVIFAAKLLLTFQVPSPWVFGDAYVYGAKTRAILTEGNFNFDQYHYGGPQIPPLYSIVLLPVYALQSMAHVDMNTVFHAILGWNAFLSTLTIIPIFLLARKFLKENQALLIAATVGFLPGTWGYVFMVMSENIFFPMVAWAVYFMYRMLNDKKPLIWEIALGCMLAFLMLTKATAIAFVSAYGVFALARLFTTTTKHKVAYIQGQLALLIAFALPMMWWSLTKDSATAAHYTAGYDTAYYTNIIGNVFSNKEAFTQMLRLISHELSYYGVATWLIGLPLIASYIWLPKKEEKLRTLWPIVGYVLLASILLVGLSTIHMMRFYEINPERYTIFGRYIESTVPLLIGLGAILLFKSKLPQKWRMPTLGLFVLTSLATVFILPRISYDLVANVPLWSLQFLSANILLLLLIVIAALGFFAIIKPKFTSFLLSIMILGSIASMPLPFKDMLRQSSEIESQISTIRNWLTENLSSEPETVIGFDEEKIWSHNYIRQFWALKFWLPNPVQKTTRIENLNKYLISPDELNYEKVTEGWELKLYRQL